MRPVELFLSVLLTDARDRRAVDEVVADWDYESSVTNGGKRRLAVDVRAATALVVTVLLIAIRQLRDVPASRALWLTLAWVALPFVLLGAAELIPWGLVRARMAGFDLPPAAFLLAWALALLPPALFAGAHRAGRRGAGELAFPGLIAAQFGANRPPLSALGLELPLSRWVALERAVLEQLALSLLVAGPLLVLLAGQLRLVAAWNTRLAPVAVSVVYVILLVYSIGARPYRLARIPLTDLSPLVPWVVPVMALLALIAAAASHARRQTTSRIVD